MLVPTWQRRMNYEQRLKHATNACETFQLNGILASGNGQRNCTKTSASSTTEYWQRQNRAPTYLHMTSRFCLRDYFHDHLQSVDIFDPGLATPHFRLRTHATFGTSVSAKLSLQFNHSGTPGRASDLRIAYHKSTRMTK
jgi:hypothetical protein